MEHEATSVNSFDDWYTHREVVDFGTRMGCLDFKGLTSLASGYLGNYTRFKREMDVRCTGFEKLEMLADNEVISPKDDLPNVSSGETAGIVRRMARNLVQNTPNVEVVSKFDDDSPHGIFARYILKSKIIGSDTYSNDMQQNLFASTKTGLTIGFDCVVPCLVQDYSKAWHIKYDTIHHRDVFPEPGAKDVRDATEVYVRRYLTRGEVMALIRNEPAGWDVAALRELISKNPTPPPRDRQSNSQADNKRKVIAEGYEIVTRYVAGGDNFVTFSPSTQLLLRVEKNKDPLKRHPVLFLVLEKDSQHPLGKSQVELLLGRQEFQDLMHNGAMKLWYRNINPSIIGYGTGGSLPNLSPGKFTSFGNPNAKLEAFEVNTQTLMQYNVISQGNLGSMVNLVGSADQQMAVQAGNGMSATPQGVEAQSAMVDITTNNYQKAIENFFSRYCSYALTLYFHELAGVKKMKVTAESRQELIGAGLDPELFNEDGTLEMDFSELATEYYVRCVPGSLVEMEDEKQLRILNQLFIPLSQAMPALAQTGDMDMLRNMAATMAFIVEREIELSGSSSARSLKSLVTKGRTPEHDAFESRAQQLEDAIGGVTVTTTEGMRMTADAIALLQQQMQQLAETQGHIMRGLGVPTEQSAPVEGENAGQESTISV